MWNARITLHINPWDTNYTSNNKNWQLLQECEPFTFFTYYPRHFALSSLPFDFYTEELWRFSWLIIHTKFADTKNHYAATKCWGTHARLCSVHPLHRLSCATKRKRKSCCTRWVVCDAHTITHAYLKFIKLHELQAQQQQKNPAANNNTLRGNNKLNLCNICWRAQKKNLRTPHEK